MRKVLIKIRRPEGHIETVDASGKFTNMNDRAFAEIRKATAEAGRGECLSYEVINEISEERLAEIKADDKKVKWFAKHGFSASDIN